MIDKDAMTEATFRQIEDVFRRVVRLLDEESTQVRNGYSADIQSFALRKEMLAFEIERLVGQQHQVVSTKEFKDLVSFTRRRIADNLGMLDAHIAAVKEVATVLLLAGDAGDTDGTYRVSAVRRRKTS